MHAAVLALEAQGKREQVQPRDVAARRLARGQDFLDAFEDPVAGQAGAKEGRFQQMRSPGVAADPGVFSSISSARAALR
jgi:hypothetical protein